MWLLHFWHVQLISVRYTLLYRAIAIHLEFIDVYVDKVYLSSFTCSCIPWPQHCSRRRSTYLWRHNIYYMNLMENTRVTVNITYLITEASAPRLYFPIFISKYGDMLHNQRLWMVSCALVTTGIPLLAWTELTWTILGIKEY